MTHFFHDLEDPEIRQPAEVHPVGAPTVTLPEPLARYREIAERYKPDGPWWQARQVILTLVRHIEALESGAYPGEVARLEHKIWLLEYELKDVRGQAADERALSERRLAENRRLRAALIEGLRGLMTVQDLL
jgi:hypothetical protein